MIIYRLAFLKYYAGEQKSECLSFRSLSADMDKQYGDAWAIWDSLCQQGNSTPSPFNVNNYP